MATYEDDHNLKPSTASLPPQNHRPRPDLTEFFNSLAVTPSNPDPTQAPPASAFRSLASLWEGNTDGGEIMEGLIRQLVEEAESGGAGQKGVPEGYLDELERIPKKNLVEADICPICNMPFLSDQFPLVVRLPCHKSHCFDLECISPWLKLHTTCPLDRIDLTRKKTPPPPVEEEEEWDENYG